VRGDNHGRLDILNTDRGTGGQNRRGRLGLVLAASLLACRGRSSPVPPPPNWGSSRVTLYKKVHQHGLL
jgi:hypothetical protein